MNSRNTILIISGSPQQGGSCQKIAHLLQTELEKLGLTAWIQPIHALPPMNPISRERPFHPDPTVAQFLEAVAASEAIILITPVYHGSFSALMKNALDHLSSDQVSGKLVGLCSHAGGMASTLPLSHLRDIARSMGCYSLTTELATSEADLRSGVLETEVEQRAHRFAMEMLQLLQVFRPARRRSLSRIL